jgi:hypothetical protein
MKEQRVAIHLPTGMVEKVPGQMRTQIDKKEAGDAWERLEKEIADISDTGDGYVVAGPWTPCPGLS